MKKSTIVLVIIAILVVVGVVLAFNIRQTNGPDEQSPQVENGEVDTEGWNKYTDEGLSYSFEYPNDWKLSPDQDSTVIKPRQEQMILEKDNSIIRIDPLGRRGSLSGPNPFGKEDLLINGVLWKHVWTNIKVFDYYDYHRFTDEEGTIVLKNDSTTNGVDSTGKSYSRRDNFRVHVLLENETNEERRIEAVNTTIKILETITVL